ncbi:MAG: glycosyltransferase family 2 protein [Terrimicrobiaceae bacterium]|nr:glycosyltransferase family 2 protein [Terrimicrobiaceae bacterium]
MPAASEPPPPRVSVVIPVFNAASYLESALASVQAQTFADFEIVAIDDGSTDRSKAILDHMAAADPRIRVISRPNTGIVGALNDGLAIARGEFIARMDGDDLSLPERFAKQVAYLSAHSDCVAVGSFFTYIDSTGARVKWNPRKTDHQEIESALLGGDGGALIHPAVMFRRKAIETVGGYRVEAQWIEDLDLYLRLALIGRLANLPEVLLHYRYHAHSVNFTRNDGRHQRKLWVMEQAYAARGLNFNPKDWPAPSINPANGAAEARDFALSSLRFFELRTPWRYALRAVLLAPTNRRSWKTLGYVAKAFLGIVPRPGAA